MIRNLMTAKFLTPALTLVLATMLSTPCFAIDTDKKLIAAKEGISWYRDFKQTLKVAKDNRKWVLVDVYTDWCHYCKLLDKDVFAHPKIAAYINKSFVCMKADAEKGDGVGVAKKYGVTGYPCTLILEPSGKEKGRLPGYLAPNDYVSALARVIKR